MSGINTEFSPSVGDPLFQLRLNINFKMGVVECRTCSNKWSYQRLLKHIYGDYFVMGLSGIGKKVMRGSPTDSTGILPDDVIIRYGGKTVQSFLEVVVYLSDGKLYEGQILAYDFYYNLAAIKLQSNVPLPTASLRHLDDSITIDFHELDILEGKAFPLPPHLSSFNLVPGDTVIALGRYFMKLFVIIVAPGEFSANCCDDYECQELFRAECKITRCGSGGPLINCFGEVIGVAFYEDLLTPFMPINVACKWWEHCKKNEEPRRLWHGMEVGSLYVADLHILEKITQKFPNIFKGVLVEEVMRGSPADSAGILPDDVIIRCGGKAVQSFLES